jgi:hypothetical protein
MKKLFNFLAFWFFGLFFAEAQQPISIEILNKSIKWGEKLQLQIKNNTDSIVVVYFDSDCFYLCRDSEISNIFYTPTFLGLGINIENNNKEIDGGLIKCLATYSGEFNRSVYCNFGKERNLSLENYLSQNKHILRPKEVKKFSYIFKYESMPNVASYTPEKGKKYYLDIEYKGSIIDFLCKKYQDYKSQEMYMDCTSFVYRGDIKSNKIRIYFPEKLEERKYESVE